MIPDTIQLVYDRTNQDLAKIKALLKKPKKFWTEDDKAYYDSASSKGAYNYTDLNRVTKAIEHFVVVVSGYGYDPKYEKIKIERKEEFRLPDGYTRLDSIKSTGTQYIDSKFKPSGNTKVIIDFQMTDLNADYVLFGSRDAGAVSTFMLFSRPNGFRSDYNNQTGIDTPFVSDRLVRLTAIKDKGKTTIENTSISVPDADFQGSYNLMILAGNNSGQVAWQSHCTLYSCEIYNDDKQVRLYIPCKNPSGAIGLFDKVSSSFFGNAGSGEFIAGIELPEPERKDPYMWYEDDEPSLEQLEQYLLNVKNLCATVMEDFSLTESMRKLSIQDANTIEKIFVDLDVVIEHIVKSMCRSNAFTFWSGNRPLPSADSDLGRTWEELDAMNVPWENLETADWFLLSYGNLGVTK